MSKIHIFDFQSLITDVVTYQEYSISIIEFSLVLVEPKYATLKSPSTTTWDNSNNAGIIVIDNLKSATL